MTRVKRFFGVAALQIDAHGNPINKRNAWSTRAAVYVRLIPPGAADTVHYRLQIPQSASGRIHLSARVNYRKFAWWNTQFSFGGARDAKDADIPRSPNFDDAHYVFTGDPTKVPGGGKGIPSLPIVAMAENAVDLNVLPANAAEPKPNVELNCDDWTRWNDYGIGLFLQGDLSGAAGAFEKITEIDPKNPDGWVNVGRARVQEGNLTAAREVLDRARMLRQEGHYDEAAEHLRVVLAQYPRDRVVHDDLGRIYFLQRRYSDAVKEFNATLAIDPEDLEANYNLMLCNTGLGRSDQASEYQKRYLRFKADESAQTLTGPYLRTHPDDNTERQPIHEHVSAQEPKQRSKVAKYSSVSGQAKDSD
jgi:tetratricopeptide (TPR) repeat protein